MSKHYGAALQHTAPTTAAAPAEGTAGGTTTTDYNGKLAQANTQQSAPYPCGTTMLPCHCPCILGAMMFPDDSAPEVQSLTTLKCDTVGVHGERAACTATNASIAYSKIPPSEYQATTKPG